MQHETPLMCVKLVKDVSSSMLNDQQNHKLFLGYDISINHTYRENKEKIKKLLLRVIIINLMDIMCVIWYYKCYVPLTI